MANRAGRVKRPNGVGANTVKSTVRLEQTSWAVAERAAAALGVSRDAYLDQVLAREAAQLDAWDRPIWWTGTAPRDQRELPLGEIERETPLKSA
jgi:hypothetical protein